MVKNDDGKNLGDEELVRKIVSSNDTDLFAVLYDRYADKVYRKCLSFSKSPDEAQDLTHDIFIRLFVKLRTFRGDSKFSTWLYSFTYNFCLNYVNRDVRKKNTVRIDDAPSLPEGPEYEDSYIYQLKTDKLQRALEKLDPDSKVVLLMKYQDDFSIQEIEESLDIGKSAAKMRLKRAKQKLIDIYNGLN